MAQVRSNQLLCHTAPLASAGLFALCPAIDGAAAVARAVAPARGVARRVGLSCALALGSNVTNYYVLGRTSPLTYQVMGHLKTILTIVVSLAALGRGPANALNLAGVALATAGVAAYTESKRRQAIRSAHRARRRDAAATPAAPRLEDARAV